MISFIYCSSDRDRDKKIRSPVALPHIERLLHTSNQGIACLHHLLELNKEAVAIVDQRLRHFASARTGLEFTIETDQMFLNSFQRLGGRRRSQAKIECLKDEKVEIYQK